LATLDAATRVGTGVLPHRTLLARTLNADGQRAEALRVAERSLASAEERRAGQRYTAAIGLALLEVADARAGVGDTAGGGKGSPARSNISTRPTGPGQTRPCVPSGCGSA
jgi:hypothetical protein